MGPGPTRGMAFWRFWPISGYRFGNSCPYMSHGAFGKHKLALSRRLGCQDGRGKAGFTL